MKPIQINTFDIINTAPYMWPSADIVWTLREYNFLAARYVELSKYIIY
jgi:hypothetical protein